MSIAQRNRALVALFITLAVLIVLGIVASIALRRWRRRVAQRNNVIDDDDGAERLMSGEIDSDSSALRAVTDGAAPSTAALRRERNYKEKTKKFILILFIN